MKIRHLARVVTASTAAIVFGLTLVAAPASATVILDTDNPHLVGTNVSFGSFAPDIFAAAEGDLQPMPSGVLLWESDGGVITPHLTGWFWTQGLSGTCAKMRIQYYNEDDVRLATRGSPEVCPDNDDLDITYVDIAPFSDPTIVRVVVSTTVEDGSGRFVINDSQTWLLN